MQATQKEGFWRSGFRRLNEAFRWDNPTVGYYRMPDLEEQLEEARREWRYAKLYFNCVTEPDLIDHAVLNLGAAEKKYIYLLKQAKATGLNVKPAMANR
ncbi:uncharacterized protein DUF2508 [Hydrogenispora ethanolica]|uniref:Uncharacterized protein DUF2508 n=1 Tax=Hydrogenispora ethanolica TaxID=1082276 RepID=A0A4V2QB58_HYDET|nr:DUF2508 family protein [Hydrogenispora ethanolica]TCL55142.1 uncharacterized protein DUF2508 [Hydrogenispora ethanolica]